MQLRNHPAMYYAGVKSWPPLWTKVKKEERITLRGEIGVLSSAYTTSNVAQICFLIIEHDSDTRVGALMLDDRSFCNAICSALKESVGRPIADIGSIDVSHLL